MKTSLSHIARAIYFSKKIIKICKMINKTPDLRLVVQSWGSVESIGSEINVKNGKLVDREQTMTQGGRKKTIIAPKPVTCGLNLFSVILYTFYKRKVRWGRINQ